MMRKTVQRLVSRRYSEVGEDIITSNPVPGIHVIHFNRPKKYNALSVEFGNQFERLMSHFYIEAEKTLIGQSNLRALILTGNGKAFSAGGDLSFLRDRMQSPATLNSAIMEDFYSRFLSMRKVPVPIISAVNGPAVGAGACLACLSDIRLCSESALFAWNFSKLGLHPGMGSTHFLPQIVGRASAAELLLTGKTISAQEALEYGIVSQSLPDNDALMDAALAIAVGVAEGSPSAVQMTTRSLRASQDRGLHQALIREADAQAHSYSSSDYNEGMDAIIEKRSPCFHPSHVPAN